MEKSINYNELAWETPIHDDDRMEYRPEDENYNVVLDWLKSLSGNTRYGPYENSINGNRCGTKRMRCSDGYDVIASFFPDTKGISYVFRPVYEYAI